MRRAFRSSLLIISMNTIYKNRGVIKTRTKFNVNKTPKDRTFDGIEFDSAMEMHYYRDVILPQVGSGQIKSFERQKPYVLQPGFEYNGNTIRPIIYICDFYVIYSDGTEEIIDIKGFADSAARMKRKLFWYRYPEKKYSWITYSKIDGGWVTYEEVNERRRERKRIKEQKEREYGKED